MQTDVVAKIPKTADEFLALLPPFEEVNRQSLNSAVKQMVEPYATRQAAEALRRHYEQLQAELGIKGSANITADTAPPVKPGAGMPLQAERQEEVENTGIGGRMEGEVDVNTLLKKSSCTADDLYRYLNKINNSFAEEYAKTGKWPSEVQIPKSPDVLNADGSIKWYKAPKGGYVLDSNGDAVKESFVPVIGEIIDRYGPNNGRFTSPVKNKKPYSYTQRSLPYLEGASQYHQYTIVGDLSKLELYLQKCTDINLKDEIYEYVDVYYGGDFSKMLTFQGEIAELNGWGIGGGIQYELPLRIEWLEALGILKEINIGL